MRIIQDQRQESQVRNVHEMLGQKTVNGALAGVNWCISGVAVISVEFSLRCCGKSQVSSLNGDNVMLFSASMFGLVWIRSGIPSHGYRCVCLVCRCREPSARDLCCLCLISEVLMPKYPEGEVSPLEIYCSNKILWFKQSGSDVYITTTREEQGETLSVCSHHSKVEAVHQAMTDSFPNLNVVGRQVPCQTLHGILSVVSRLKELSICGFSDKKKMWACVPVVKQKPEMLASWKWYHWFSGSSCLFLSHREVIYK